MYDSDSWWIWMIFFEYFICINLRLTITWVNALQIVHVNGCEVTMVDVLWWGSARWFVGACLQYPNVTYGKTLLLTAFLRFWHKNWKVLAVLCWELHVLFIEGWAGAQLTEFPIARAKQLLGTTLKLGQALKKTFRRLGVSLKWLVKVEFTPRSSHRASWSKLAWATLHCVLSTFAHLNPGITCYLPQIDNGSGMSDSLVC